MWDVSTPCSFYKCATLCYVWSMLLLLLRHNYIATMTTQNHKLFVAFAKCESEWQRHNDDIRYFQLGESDNLRLAEISTATWLWLWVYSYEKFVHCPYNPLYTIIIAFLVEEKPAFKNLTKIYPTNTFILAEDDLIFDACLFNLDHCDW